MSDDRNPRMTVPPSRYALFFLIAAAGCAADLATKSWIFGRLGMPDGRHEIPLWRGVFSLTTSLNEGALFGIGQGWVFGFAALSIAAALFIVYWLFYAGAARDALLTLALALVTAGIFGNLYDRLGLPGLKWPDGEPVFAVRDWLHFEIRQIRFDWPVFNIADSLLVCGAALLFWHVWFLPRTPGGEQPAGEPPGADDSSAAVAKNQGGWEGAAGNSSENLPKCF